MSFGTLRGVTCVVTGASSGIGRAIAVALASADADVCAVARRLDALQATADQADGAGRFELYETDLERDRQVDELARVLLARGGVDALIHSAGTHSLGNLETAPIDDLDRQYSANVRAPYLLTQSLLPSLRARAGQIIFINSTVGLVARANVSQFAATQHALKAIADSLREEINSDGVRVVSLYPGRTATPRQERIHEAEGRTYPPERLMQPADVADLVLTALTLPRTAEVTDLRVRPMFKPANGGAAGQEPSGVAGSR